MSEFIPDDVSTFVVTGNHVNTVFEDLLYTEPTEIHGAYFTHEAGKQVSVYVMDPNHQVIYKRSAEMHGIIYFLTTTAGKYTFIFSNLDDYTERTVTFALHTFQEQADQIRYDINEDQEIEIIFDPKDEKENFAVPTQEQQKEQIQIEVAKKEDSQKIKQFLKKTEKQANQMLQETKFSWERQKNDNEEIASNGFWYLVEIIIELFFFMGILLYQLIHMKKNLENKLII